MQGTNSLPLHLPMLPIVAAVLVPVVLLVVAGALHSGRKPIQFASKSIALQKVATQEKKGNKNELSGKQVAKSERQKQRRVRASP